MIMIKTYFQFLDISKKPSMKVKRLRLLIAKIFKPFFFKT